MKINLQTHIRLEKKKFVTLTIAFHLWILIDILLGMEFSECSAYRIIEWPLPSEKALLLTSCGPWFSSFTSFHCSCLFCTMGVTDVTQ